MLKTRQTVTEQRLAQQFPCISGNQPRNRTTDKGQFFKERPGARPEALDTPSPTYQPTANIPAVKITKVGVKELVFSNQEKRLSIVSCRLSVAGAVEPDSHRSRPQLTRTTNNRQLFCSAEGTEDHRPAFQGWVGAGESARHYRHAFQPGDPGARPRPSPGASALAPVGRLAQADFCRRPSMNLDRQPLREGGWPIRRESIPQIRRKREFDCRPYPWRTISRISRIRLPVPACLALML